MEEEVKDTEAMVEEKIGFEKEYTHTSIAENEELIKKWTFKNDNNTTKIIITNKRLIATGQDENRKARTSIRLEDIRGVNYKIVNNNTSKVPGLICLMGGIMFIILGLILSSNKNSIPNIPLFIFGFIMLIMAVCLLLVKGKSSVYLQLQLTPYKGLLFQDTPLTKEDDNVAIPLIEICKNEEVVSDKVLKMLYELDNLIIEILDKRKND